MDSNRNLSIPAGMGGALRSTVFLPLPLIVQLKTKEGVSVLRALRDSNLGMRSHETSCESSCKQVE